MSKLYLAAGAVLLGLVIFLFVVPFAISYAQYLGGLKGFRAGAYVTYYGRLLMVASGSASINRSVYFTVDLGFNLTLRRRVGGGFTASLVVFNITHVGGKAVADHLVFRGDATLSPNDPLIKLLFPNSTRVEIGRYGYEVMICPHPSPYVLANRGLPSDLGVPKYYVGALIIRDAGIVVTSVFKDNYPSACFRLIPHRSTGMLFNYVRVGNRFMMVDYRACYGGFMCGITNRTVTTYFLRHGSPLLNILVDDFGFSYLRHTLYRLRLLSVKYSIYPEEAEELLTLGRTNVWPTDQQWLAGLEGLYMTATPFSQAMTVAAVVLLALYFRRR